MIQTKPGAHGPGGANSDFLSSGFSSTVIPEPPGNRFLGHAFDVSRNFLGSMSDWQQQLGDIVRFRLGQKKFFLVSHPDFAEEVLIRKQDVFSKVYNCYSRPRGLALVLGNGLVTSQGEHWQRQRRMIQPVFHKSHIAEMSSAIRDAGLDQRRQWGSLTDNHISMMNEDMLGLTLEVITRTMFGTSVQKDAARLAEALEVALKHTQSDFFSPFSLPAFIPTPGRKRFRKALHVLKEIMTAVIEHRRMSGERRNDLLDVLLYGEDRQTGERMTTREVMDEALTIFSAGHETTANALTWTWYMLARHPEIRDAVHAELDAELDGATPDFSDLARLPVTRSVIEESLRLYPSIVVIVRIASEDTRIGNHPVPKGTVVVVNIRNIQRHPDYWNRPDEFRPERFLQTGKTAHRLAWMPFGAGQRVCIGKHMAMNEAHLLLAMLAQRYEANLPDGHQVEEHMAISLRPKGGMPMKISARKSR